MIQKDISNILNSKNSNIQQKLLALDVSQKHLGLAISDSLLKLAFPYKTIVRSNFKKDIDTILKIIEKEGISSLVIGYPLNLEGNKNSRTQSIDSFIKEILKIKDLDIYLQDERFSTQFAKSKNTSNKKDNSLDAKAASCFLQIFLDKINYSFSNC